MHNTRSSVEPATPRRGSFFSVHAHSKCSTNDAMPDVEAMVATAVDSGYPALGLTDHGVLTGIPRFYRAARAAGIEPMPGVELYVARDRAERVAGHNLHLTVAAISEEGYRNLVRLVTMSYRNYFFKPIVDLADLADLAEHGYTAGLVVGTGCHFGLVPTTLRLAGERHAARLVRILDSLFDAAYVELINHGVEQEDGWTDDMAVEALVSIATETGVPYLITADSHYLRPEEQELHDAFKTLMAFGEDPDDAVFPGGAYCFQTEASLRTYFEPKVIEVALDTLADLADRSWCRIPELEHQIKRVPKVAVERDAQELLTDLVAAALSWRRVRRGRREVLADEVPAYRDRAAEELEVIAATGTADYFLLAEWLCTEMTDRDIWFRARGSANSSLVCWALGITKVDPIEAGLLFGRFLTADRAKMPDIDLDIEHVRREEAVALLSSRYATMRVGTLTTYSIAGEAEDPDDAQRGSLRVRYMSLKRKRGVELSHFAEAVRNLPGEVEALHRLSGYGLIAGYGRHPSGFIVAPSTADLELLPLYRMPKSGVLICAYDQGDVEDLGYMKLDLLGSKTLTAAHVSCSLVAPADPLGYFESIPENDEATYRRIREAKVAGVFQLDGAAMRRGLRSLKPRRFTDLVVANALFRPAVTETGGDITYVVRRDGVAPIPTRHPDIEAVVAETMGVALYQEQTLNLLRALGMPPVEWNRLLKAVKASNENIGDARAAIEAAAPRVRELALARGWSEADIAFFADALTGYANYAFGKGHSYAYAQISIREAYLAEHHRPAFWVGKLNAHLDDDETLDRFLVAARRDGVVFLEPHVNFSAVGFSLEEGRYVRAGLNSIPGIGPVAAAELAAHAPYTSLADLAGRVRFAAVKGAKLIASGKAHTAEQAGAQLKLLADAGALSGLGEE